MREKYESLSLASLRDIAKAREILSNCKIYIDDSAMITPQQVLSKCRRLKRRHGLDLVMIDYIQLMTGGNKNADNRQQEVSEISRSLKVLAKEMKVPVLALSQLSRGIETRTDQTPQLSDIRESGAIEQDADIVMFISRKKEIKDENDNPNIAEISISKHRNGPTGTIKLFFKGECTKFMNLEDNQQTEETPQEEKAELNEITPNSPENERVSDFEQVGFEDEDKEYDNEDYSDDTDGEIFG